METIDVTVYDNKTVVDIDARDVALVYFGFTIRLLGVLLFRWLHPFLVMLIGFAGLDVIDSLFVYFFSRFVRFDQYVFMDKFMDYAFHSALLVWPVIYDETIYRLAILVFLLGYRLLGDIIFLLGRVRRRYIYFPNMFIWAYFWFYLVDFAGLTSSPQLDLPPLVGFLAFNVGIEFFIHRGNIFGLQQKTKVYIQRYFCGRTLYLDKYAKSNAKFVKWIQKEEFEYETRKDDDCGFDYVI